MVIMIEVIPKQDVKIKTYDGRIRVLQNGNPYKCILKDNNVAILLYSFPSGFKLPGRINDIDFLKDNFEICDYGE